MFVEMSQWNSGKTRSNICIFANFSSLDFSSIMYKIRKKTVFLICFFCVNVIIDEICETIELVP